MNPQAKTTRQNERGALMIEAIALLGLMTMMSPMVVRQTADRTAEMEEVAIAGQMKEMKDALSNWIDAHYQERTAAFANSNTLDTHFTVNASQLAEYLSANYLDGSNFRGNKLADGFDIGVRAQCTEAARTDGSDCVSGTCYTMTNGAVTSITDTATTKCSRYKMTGMILSRSDSEIDDRRASRIASMIGADGGYMRTSTLVNAMSAGSAATEMTKIMGAQGIWEGNVGDFFTGMSTARGGRVAATTTYSSGFSGDYLYRKKVDGLPGANSMFTDLDMGGATECNADGCHKINNAGGMEVIGGKILIRSRNGAAARDGVVGNSGDADYARIALATDESHIYSNNSVTIGIDASSASVRVAPGTVNLTPGVMSDTYMNMRGGNVGIHTRGSDLNVLSSAIYGRSGDIELDAVRTFEASGRAGAAISSGSGPVTLYSGRNMLLDAVGNLDMGGQNTNIDGGYINATAQRQFNARILNSNTSVNMTNGAIRQRTTHTQINMSDASRWVHMQAEGSGLTIANTYMSGFVPRTSSEKVTFGLDNKGFDISLGNHAAMASTLRRLFYQNNGLELYTRADGISDGYGHLTREGHRIDFTYGDSRMSNHRLVSIVASQGSNPTSKGAAISIIAGEKIHNADPDPFDNPLVSLYGESGRISGGFFQPERIAMNRGVFSNTVRNRIVTSIDQNTGAQTVEFLDGADTRVPGAGRAGRGTSMDARVIIGNDALGSDYVPYFSHDGDSDYDRFRVDPAFISVMNDIKVTSRGGARLSEALPNYILKGIYEMTNSYGSGPWPCDDRENVESSCTWSVPEFTKDDLFLSAASPEFSCTVEGGTHPIRNGGGRCDDNSGYVTFHLYAGAYTECPNDNCWAHPYMGAVPAPGRRVTNSGEAGMAAREDFLAADDEGVCPDGYQAVMTLTPTSFDVGRVSYINPNYDITSAKVAYNAGWQDFKNESNRRAAGIMQAATRIGIYTLPIVQSGVLNGWKIAMGTITPYGSTGGYIWNAGGVSANSMGAVAHTYCYFNPQRFNMPNMNILSTGSSGNILTPMDNPIMGSNSDWML